MDEYASRFFVLLHRATELEKERLNWDLTAASFPHMKPAAKTKIIGTIQNTAATKADTMKVKDDRTKLRKLFSGKALI